MGNKSSPAIRSGWTLEELFKQSNIWSAVCDLIRSAHVDPILRNPAAWAFLWTTLVWPMFDDNFLNEEFLGTILKNRFVDPILTRAENQVLGALLCSFDFCDDLPEHNYGQAQLLLLINTALRNLITEENLRLCSLMLFYPLPARAYAECSDIKFLYFDVFIPVVNIPKQSRLQARNDFMELLQYDYRETDNAISFSVNVTVEDVQFTHIHRVRNPGYIVEYARGRYKIPVNILESEDFQGVVNIIQTSTIHLLKSYGIYNSLDQWYWVEGAQFVDTSRCVQIFKAVADADSVMVPACSLLVLSSVTPKIHCILQIRSIAAYIHTTTQKLQNYLDAHDKIDGMNLDLNTFKCCVVSLFLLSCQDKFLMRELSADMRKVMSLYSNNRHAFERRAVSADGWHILNIGCGYNTLEVTQLLYLLASHAEFCADCDDKKQDTSRSELAYDEAIVHNISRKDQNTNDFFQLWLKSKTVLSLMCLFWELETMQSDPPYESLLKNLTEFLQSVIDTNAIQAEILVVPTLDIIYKISTTIDMTILLPNSDFEIERLMITVVRILVMNNSAWNNDCISIRVDAILKLITNNIKKPLSRETITELIDTHRNFQTNGEQLYSNLMAKLFLNLWSPVGCKVNFESFSIACRSEIPPTPIENHFLPEIVYRRLCWQMMMQPDFKNYTKFLHNEGQKLSLYMYQIARIDMENVKFDHKRWRELLLVCAQEYIM